MPDARTVHAADEATSSRQRVRYASQVRVLAARRRADGLCVCGQRAVSEKVRIIMFALSKVNFSTAQLLSGWRILHSQLYREEAKYTIGTAASKRYVKAVMDSGNFSPAFLLCAIARGDNCMRTCTPVHKTSIENQLSNTIMRRKAYAITYAVVANSTRKKQM